MAENKLRLRILTPDEVKVDENVEMVIMRSTTGAMGIMANHEARSAVLKFGVVRILDGGEEYGVAVFGGIAEMKDNVLTILTGEAHHPSDIDIEAAEASRKDTEQRLEEKTSLEIAKDQIALRRSLVQIEVSSYLNINSSRNSDEKSR